MRQLSASAARRPSSNAARLRTGSDPGWPRQMGQTWVLGGAPNWMAQPQKSFVRVFS